MKRPLQALDDVIAEERAAGRPIPWCRPCLWWHFGACPGRAPRPWWERLLIELM